MKAKVGDWIQVILNDDTIVEGVLIEHRDDGTLKLLNDGTNNIPPCVEAQRGRAIICYPQSYIQEILPAYDYMLTFRALQLVIWVRMHMEYLRI